MMNVSRSEFNDMLEDIAGITGYMIEFARDDNGIRHCRVWQSITVLFADYTGASFVDALRNAWCELCG